MYLFLFWISALCSILSPNPVAETESIEVAFTFDKPCEGQIFISCYQDIDGFQDPDKAVYSNGLTCQNTITIEGIDPALPRAIMGFIDLNGNKELDKNLFGVPIEPYAISNACRAKWQAPCFEDAAEAKTTKKILLEFKYWKNR